MKGANSSSCQLGRRRSCTRVLHVVKAAGIGGAERHLLTLLPRLQQQGVTPRALVATSGDGEAFVQELVAAGLDVVERPAGRDLSPALYQDIVREIREFEPDLVHTHLIHADVHALPAARRFGIATVSSIHSAHRFYRRSPYRYFSRLASRTIAISKFVGRYAARSRLNSADAIRIVPYGVEVDDWGIARDLSARAPFAGGDDDVTFGIAARLISGKGHAVAIEAFRSLCASMPNLRLLIAGEGPLRVELERHARSAGDRIRLLGFVEDMRSFLGACDVLVFPTLQTLSEGFGLAALEAMASARPVIATRVGSLPEVVDDGATGLLVSPGGSENLRAAMARLASARHERREMGERGRRRAREQFNADLMIQRTIAVYDELVHSPRP